MAKIIRFSRFFSKSTFREKETHFVSKILIGAGLKVNDIVYHLHSLNRSIMDDEGYRSLIDNIKETVVFGNESTLQRISALAKFSTIRERPCRYVRGDTVPLYSWCGYPYKSKLLKICDAKIMSKMPVLIDKNKIALFYETENGVIAEKDVYYYGSEEYSQIANQDGLTSYQFARWFKVYNSNHVFRGYITYFKCMI